MRCKNKASEKEIEALDEGIQNLRHMPTENRQNCILETTFKKQMKQTKQNWKQQTKWQIIDAKKKKSRPGHVTMVSITIGDTWLCVRARSWHTWVGLSWDTKVSAPAGKTVKNNEWSSWRICFIFEASKEIQNKIK